MSEMKRVTLTTIGDVVKKSPFGGSGLDQNTDNFFSGALAGGSATGPSSGSKGNTSGKVRKTVRLELELFEPTAKSFPEFNYSKLVREEQKRQRKIEKKTTTNGFLSDADGDDDVARIARELEKKYGSGTAYSSTGKFAKPSQLDYCDRGAGYDEEDSFIDNTEAYDELIPQEVETVGGGFYINSGQLEFKTLSNFERPEDALRMPKPKKRILSSSSDSSEPEEEVRNSKVTVKAKGKTKKDELTGSTGTSEAESAAGKGGSKPGRKRLNGHVEKKQKVAEGKKNAKSVANKEGKKKKESKEVVNAGAGASGGGKEVKVVKTTTVKDMLRAKRDSLRKMEQEKKGRSSGSVSSSEAEEEGNEEGDEDDDDEDGSDSSDSGSSESGSDDSDSESASSSEKETKINGETETKKVDAVKLPDNLPDHLLQDLTSLKEIAKNVNGRLNYFDAKVADLLLQIDVSSRMCGGNARNSIYKHLEAHLQVSRQTLMVKIKKIRIRKEENKVKKALEKLEDAVSEMMPRVITCYEMEKQKAVELRNSLLAAGGDGSEKPDVKTPRKKFPWNDLVRGLLYDIATIRKQSFHILRPRKETEEEYIHSYLKKSVVPLWPSGWVKFEDLQKELDRRKKTASKTNGKEIKKAVQLSSSTTSSQTQQLANGPTSRQETVLPPSTSAGSSKSEEKKVVRPPPQSSPVTTVNTSQPPPSTSPAATKKTYNHSIINIISSPPSKSSSHSSNVLSQPQSQQPPRPQSQPHRPAGTNFDEEFLQTHVINLGTSHATVKKSPPIASTSTMDYLPKDLRINSPALSSASSASSSRRQSSYQDQPPVAHSTPPNAHASSNRKNRKSHDDDSDSSIEIIGEYSVAEKSADPLNLALPTLNKDKYKKMGNTSKTKHGSGNSSSPGIGATGVNINNNNMEKAKYSGVAAMAAGGFALPSMAGMGPDMKKSPAVPPRMVSAPGELDVIRIMKELQELQAIQISSINKAAAQKNDSQKPMHTSSSSTGAKKMEFTKHQAQSAAAPQHQQQSSHHKKPTVNMNGSGGSKANTGAIPKVLSSATEAMKKAGQK